MHRVERSPTPRGFLPRFVEVVDSHAQILHAELDMYNINNRKYPAAPTSIKTVCMSNTLVIYRLVPLLCRRAVSSSHNCRRLQPERKNAPRAKHLFPVLIVNITLRAFRMHPILLYVVHRVYIFPLFLRPTPWRLMFCGTFDTMQGVQTVIDVRHILTIARTDK